ncbi:MAG TPA: hypothetical protein VFA80_10330 [Xanthobacteraceae bacterium]|nr:hypothetical protein [Xanthobacteraceae bacterium]
MSQAAPQSPLIDMIEQTAAYRRAVDDALARPVRKAPAKESGASK